MSDFNFEDFKSTRQDMVQSGDLRDKTGEEAVFVNHGLDAIFSIQKIFAGVSDNPQSYYEGHPYHSFVLDVVEIKDQADHKPFHEKDLENGLEPQPAKQVREGQAVKQWCALPRVPNNPNSEEKRLLEKCLRMWAAVFHVESALVDMADVQGITDEDGAELEDHLIGIKYSPRSYEYEDDRTGEEKWGTTIDVYPYPVDQDTLERVDLRGAFDVAEQMVEQCQAGSVEVEKVAEMLDYLIEIEEMPESDAEEFMAKVT